MPLQYNYDENLGPADAGSISRLNIQRLLALYPRGYASAEKIAEGFVSAYISPTERILGDRIVGEGAGEMIGGWALAIQKKIRITDIMMLQHSFPTMSFLTKQVYEKRMMSKMKSKKLQTMCRFMFR